MIWFFIGFFVGLFTGVGLLAIVVANTRLHPEDE